MSIITVMYNTGLMEGIWSPLTKPQFMCGGGFKFQFYGFKDLLGASLDKNTEELVRQKDTLEPEVEKCSW